MVLGYDFFSLCSLETTGRKIVCHFDDLGSHVCSRHVPRSPVPHLRDRLDACTKPQLGTWSHDLELESSLSRVGVLLRTTHAPLLPLGAVPWAPMRGWGVRLTSALSSRLYEMGRLRSHLHIVESQHRG